MCNTKIKENSNAFVVHVWARKSKNDAWNEKKKHHVGVILVKLVSFCNEQKSGEDKISIPNVYQNDVVHSNLVYFVDVPPVSFFFFFLFSTENDETKNRSANCNNLLKTMIGL